MPPQSEWSIVFVVPSLGYVESSGSPDPRASHNLTGLAIVPASDERVAAIRSEMPVADALLSSFHLDHGAPFAPMVLIASRAWLADFGRDPEPVVSFRNVLCLADVLLTVLLNQV